MPYQITSEPGLVRVICFGEFSTAHLHALADDIEAIERSLAVCPNRLIDLRQISDAHLNYPNMLTFAERRKRQRMANPVKTAVVALLPVTVGFARMFQTLNEHPQLEIRIFATLEDAELWLASV